MYTLLIFCVPAVFLVCMPLYFVWKRHEKKALACAAKGLATCFALLVAVTGYRIFGADWRLFCLTGLALCAVADVVLEYHLVGGMAFFMGGHVCYIISLFQRHSFDGITLILWAVLLMILFLLLRHWRGLVQKEQWLPFILYGAVLSLMGACGLRLLWLGTLPGLLGALGAGMFALSDAMVCAEILRPRRLPFEVVALSTYYAAQLLIGAACL